MTQSNENKPTMQTITDLTQPTFNGQERQDAPSGDVPDLPNLESSTDLQHASTQPVRPPIDQSMLKLYKAIDLAG